MIAGQSSRDLPQREGGVRIAALDIGTNSVLLTIAESGEKPGDFAILSQKATVTRLGKDVDRTGELHPEAVARTLACLESYRRELDAFSVERARAVGTSALRDARGGSDFVGKAQTVLGFAPEIVSGLREAELTFVGGLSGVSASGQCFVFDIGGGSTELIVGHTGDGETLIEQCTSLNIGSVRLTERCCVQDPPTRTNLICLRKCVSSALLSCKIVVPAQTPVIGVAGTVTTLAAMAKGMSTYDPAIIHGSGLELRTISDLVRELEQMTIAERLGIVGLTSGRADVILAGAILCEEILTFAHADRLIASDRGVRFGLLAELAQAV